MVARPVDYPGIKLEKYSKAVQASSHLAPQPYSSRSRISHIKAFANNTPNRRVHEFNKGPVKWLWEGEERRNIRLERVPAMERMTEGTRKIEI